MSNVPANRNRWMLPAPKPPLLVALEFLKRPDVWARVAICFLTAAILWGVMGAWAPPFKYRIRSAPLRDLYARTAFEFADLDATDEERDRARSKILCLYENDRRPLEDLRQALIDALFEIKQKTFDEVREKQWPRFNPPPTDGREPPSLEQAEQMFLKFQQALAADEKLETVKQAVEKAFLSFDRNGLLEDLKHEFGQGSMQEVEVYPKGNIEDRRRVKVSEIRIAEIRDQLHENLVEELTKESETISDASLVADRIFDWLQTRLPATLRWDKSNSKRAAKLAALAVEIQTKKYEPGDALPKLNNRSADTTVIAAGSPLDAADIELLKAEHDALVAQSSYLTRAFRTVFFFGMFAAIFTLICGYLFYRDRRLITELRQFAVLQGLMLFTLTLAWISSFNLEWRSEVIPTMLFAMTIAIAYNIELSLVLSTAVALIFTVAHGYGLAEFVTLNVGSCTCALLCRSIRSRTRLVYIGLVSAAVVFPTVVGCHYLLGQPLGQPLFVSAAWFAGSAGFAGLFMLALLPFLERWFDIQTDISLLELSDANHPLLRELVQRAPGTYNHSINVASISEAAAKAIGANGLLCRVGAYFHDIGKLRKPEYFIENQAGGENKHDDLNPAMSTLVIIAHVKDGAEIGRTHRLPQRIIDLIEQHHGTTLVEYFYKRAAQQSEGQQDSSDVDESTYRYPGPKPQTPEAAVMMLADAVESASRALREPTPARIKGLVNSLAKKKLDDGQFDECSITVQQLNTIQQSLIKSLNAMYHARVKYPDQQSA